MGGALAGGLARLYLGVKATFAGATIGKFIFFVCYISMIPLTRNYFWQKSD